MKRSILALLFLFGCDVAPETEETSGSTLAPASLISTWQSANATLALTGHPYPTDPAYAFIGPNGGISMGSYKVSGNSIQIGTVPATFTLSGDMLTVVTQDWTQNFRRANTYCIPTNAMQSCQ